MKRECIAAIVLALSTTAAMAGGAKLVEPKLHVAGGNKSAPVVALTFDACTGLVDNRILTTLIENQIPSTVFVTARWLKHNSAIFQTMLSHPDLFEIENHGENHIPAVDWPVKVYGIDAAGSTDAVKTEILNGAEAITANGGSAPVWFRGATAKYTPSSIKLARTLGFKVAGYSLNGDVGASLSEAQSEKNIAAARDGDVILAHINQPTRPAGAGVVKGILDLKARGVQFVRLADQLATGSDSTTTQSTKAGL